MTPTMNLPLALQAHCARIGMGMRIGGSLVAR